MGGDRKGAEDGKNTVKGKRNVLLAIKKDTWYCSVKNDFPGSLELEKILLIMAEQKALKAVSLPPYF